MIDDPRAVLALALGDDELVLGHRHSHWTGVAPHLEEDLAFSSIAQDEIGHAVVWYSLAAERTGKDIDAIGLGRPVDGYRNAVICEQPNGDWGYTTARHLLYDLAEDVRLEVLADSAWREAADATGALRREERYHLLHARTWVERLAGGPVEARRKLAEGLISALSEALGLFEPLPDEDELVGDGILPRAHAELLQEWLDEVAADLGRCGLERVLEEGHAAPEGDFVPTSSGEMTEEPVSLTAPHIERDGGRWTPVGEFSGRGGRHGNHSEDFDDVWEEMTGTYRAHPGARW